MSKRLATLPEDLQAEFSRELAARLDAADRAAETPDDRDRLREAALAGVSFVIEELHAEARARTPRPGYCGKCGEQVEDLGAHMSSKHGQPSGTSGAGPVTFVPGDHPSLAKAAGAAAHPAPPVDPVQAMAHRDAGFYANEPGLVAGVSRDLLVAQGFTEKPDKPGLWMKPLEGKGATLYFDSRPPHDKRGWAYAFLQGKGEAVDEAGVEALDEVRIIRAAQEASSGPSAKPTTPASRPAAAPPAATTAPPSAAAAHAAAGAPTATSAATRPVLPGHARVKITGLPLVPRLRQLGFDYDPVSKACWGVVPTSRLEELAGLVKPVKTASIEVVEEAV